MEFTQSQQVALDAITSWDKRGKFILRGAAGTGKSTLMREVINQFSSTGVTLLAPTGKAGVRLTETTGQRATTVHAAIYNAFKNRRGELKFSVRQDAECGGVAIVDESSMVTERMASDLEKCFDGVLYIGDHYQLPPVKAADWFGSQKADAELTEVLRQALDSPILSLVTAIRQGKPTPTSCMGDELVIKSAATVDDMLAADQVICATNKSRESLNALMRGKLGRQGPIQVGDRLINLRNVAKGEQYICNGAQGVVTEAVGDKWKILFDGGEEVVCPITTDAGLFEQKYNEPGERKTLPGDLLLVDMAYCVTAHRAQGSQWDSVLVYDDSGYMRDAVERRKWQYVALSRSSKRLVWIRKT
jgi:exodeoxyribonuclease V